ncbi:hypothetical protein D3C84_1292990 [compost metagenome]
MLHGLDRVIAIAAQIGVAHRLHQIIMLGKPLAGVPMKRLHHHLATGRQALVEKLAEQRMEAIPGRTVV